MYISLTPRHVFLVHKKSETQRAFETRAYSKVKFSDLEVDVVLAIYVGKKSAGTIPISSMRCLKLC